MSASSYLPQSTVIWTAQDTISLLTCSRCGHTFEPWAWQPRVRCPRCHTLGYPDRAGRNLLVLDWQCPDCDHTNPATQNFCISCGNGLATRCLRCEQPVYTSVCDHCGAPQSRLAHLMRKETQRETWVPLLREHIREQQSKRQDYSGAVESAEPSHIVAADPSYGVKEWQKIDQEMRAAAAARSQRFAAKRRRGARIGGWVALIIGLLLLITLNRAELGALVQGTGVVDTTSRIISNIFLWFRTQLGPVVGLSGDFLQYWGKQIAISLQNSPALDDTGYAIMFATVLFGLALLPALLYLLGRLIQRIFP